jgi:hypothetical protein
MSMTGLLTVSTSSNSGRDVPGVLGRRNGNVHGNVLDQLKGSGRTLSQVNGGDGSDARVLDSPGDDT